MSTPFATKLYEQVKQLFPIGTLETLVAASGGPSSKLDPTIQLVHIPSGLEITCGEFPSQTEKYIAAAIRLRIAVDHSAADRNR
jgi:hypothetical protein